MLSTLAARVAGRRDLPEVPAGALVACARANRVHLLLAGALDRADPRDAAIWGALAGEYREAAARDAAEARAVERLLAVASAHGVHPLVFKGAALAPILYERSWERPRSDVDLFIDAADAGVMRRALEAAGYVRAAAVDGALVTGQFQYVHVAPGHLPHGVDVHTRLFNPAAFHGALAWRDAASRAVALPALGPAARTFSYADALFVACLHRVAHHRGEADLIWICDIDRLARRLDAGAWAALAGLAARARVRVVCASGLAAAAALLGTPVPEAVMASLASPGHEPSAAFLRRRGGELTVQWLNLRHLPGWRARAALVAQHLCPSTDYMRARYGVESRWRLPLCYAHRLCAGVPRWLLSQRS